MNISDIEQHRIEKVDSLFSNKVEFEKTKFLKKLSLLNFPQTVYKEILEDLGFALNIDYGEGPLCKYYVTHPIRVASYCVDWQLSENFSHPDMISAALIHNCLEKNFLNKESLEDKFGSWVSKTISTLTVDRDNQYKGDWLVGYYQDVEKLDIPGQMLKVLDKLDNIYALCLNPDKFIRDKYLEEIQIFIKPKMKNYYFSRFDYFSALVENAFVLEYKSKNQFGYLS